MTTVAAAEFKLFEKEVVAILARRYLTEKEQLTIFTEGECWLEDDHEAGYFINVRHPLIPKERHVVSEPAVLTEVGECCVGFVIFMENHELSIDAFVWGEANVPPDFRDRVKRITAGKIENGKFLKQE